MVKKPRVEKSKDILNHIDPRKRVRVYRNLHNQCYSVKQNNLVLVHADVVSLEEVKFIVSKAGQKRVRDEKKKNVHAFVEGYVVDSREADNHVDGNKSDEDLFAGKSDWLSVYYNPYKCDGFTTPTDRIAEFAEFAMLDQYGVLASGISVKSEVYI